jgi:hypothetical protein
MTRGTRRIFSALLAAAVSLGILIPVSSAFAARDVAGELRKERGQIGRAHV